IAEQLLATVAGQYPTLKLNKNSVAVLKGEKKVWMYTAPIPNVQDADFHEGLFAILRELRKTEADKNNVPPYVLFSDATLKDLCRYFPTTKDAMLEIKGIGEKKYEQYGELFSNTIQKWLAENPDVKPKVQITSTHRPTFRRITEDDQYDGPSHMASYKLFQS